MPTHEDGAESLPIEIAGILGGVARRVTGPTGLPTDSMLAVYKARLTYTFIVQNEVASIHFDKARGEIFFRGHNIKFMPLSEAERQALCDLAEILDHDRKGERLARHYRETLDHLLADTSL